MFTAIRTESDKGKNGEVEQHADKRQRMETAGRSKETGLQDVSADSFIARDFVPFSGDDDSSNFEDESTVMVDKENQGISANTNQRHREDPRYYGQHSIDELAQAIRTDKRNTSAWVNYALKVA